MDYKQWKALIVREDHVIVTEHHLRMVMVFERPVEGTSVKWNEGRRSGGRFQESIARILVQGHKSRNIGGALIELKGGEEIVMGGTTKEKTYRSNDRLLIRVYEAENSDKMPIL